MIKDKIGLALTKFLMPYITQDYKRRNDVMKNQLDYEEYCLREKYLWFLGDEALIRDFYRIQYTNFITYNPRKEYYYSQTTNNIRIVHSGLPSLLAYAKARLLTTGDMDFFVENKRGTEDKEKTKTLKAICKDNKIMEIIKKSILIETWGGRFAWKIMFDQELSEFPIVELYNPLEYETVTKCDRLQAIIFKTPIEKDNDKYVLEEEYGKGYIDYFLYRIIDGQKRPVELNYLEETKDLERVELKDKTIILAGEKKIEKSDFEGLISEFDSLDETWSQLMDEIRLARSEVYIPEQWLTNKTFNKFRKNFAELSPDTHENTTQKIEHIQPDIRVEQYKGSINTITNNILVSVGISPFTVGIDDGIGANASGESLSKREANSLRTRDEMIKAWEPFIKSMFKLLMQANDIFNKRKPEEYDISVSFEDYITPSKQEIVEQTKMLMDANIIDTEKALEEVYGDTLKEEEKIRILANTGNITELEEPIEE